MDRIQGHWRIAPKVALCLAKTTEARSPPNGSSYNLYLASNMCQVGILPHKSFCPHSIDVETEAQRLTNVPKATLLVSDGPGWGPRSA